MNKFKCPYCGIDKNIKKVPFVSWSSITIHIRFCTKANNEYIITDKFGPIHYTEFLYTPIKELKLTYGVTNLRDMNKKFKKNGIITVDIYKGRKHTKDSVIKAIQHYHLIHNKVPTSFEFNKAPGFPSSTTVGNYFGSWGKGLEAAGF